MKHEKNKNKIPKVESKSYLKGLDEGKRLGFKEGYSIAKTDVVYFPIFCMGFLLGLLFLPALNFMLEEKPVVTSEEVCEYLGYDYYRENTIPVNNFCYNSPNDLIEVSNEYYDLIEDYLLNKKMSELKGDTIKNE